MPERVTKTERPIESETVNLSDSDPTKPKRRGRPKGSVNRPRLSGVKDGLMGYVAMLGTTLSMFPRTQMDGHVILQNGEPLVDSLVELAKADKRVAKALTIMVTGGAWTGVIIASANIALPIAANHHLLPAFMAPMFSVEVEASDNGDSAEATTVFEYGQSNG